VILRLAQGLRLIRDTTTGIAADIAGRTLYEAGIPDPPDEPEITGSGYLP
jgi:hypothetical protein